MSSGRRISQTVSVKDGLPKLCCYILVASSVLLTILLLMDRYYPLQTELTKDHSTLVLDKNGRLLRGFTTKNGIWRLPVDPNQVDSRYLQMLLAYEDQRFYSHIGVDPLAFARAVTQWLRHGEIISGASTLTMQLARLLHPQPRTLGGKLRQMLRALQLEWHYDKKTILTWYLQLAPFGGNLEGIRAASLAYFGKEPVFLSAADAALLVVLPQKPSQLRPDRFTDAARQARNKVLRRMSQSGILTDTELTEALTAPIPNNRQPLPLHAPHLATHLRRENPKKHIVQTTIDKDMQATLERLLAQLGLERQASAALVVVDNVNASVLAYIGSAGFFDSDRAGQIDMVRAIRSPGSTLKPLIYGMAFDDLIAHPESLVNDVPTAFSGYRPGNFQNVYLGQITVREALQQSQNIPAVIALERVGPARLAGRLREAGIRLFWPHANTKPGLPMALGGVGVTLLDLVRLYTALANNGAVLRVKFLQHSGLQPAQKNHAILGVAATWYLKEILRATPPPDSQLPAGNDASQHLLAHKTGTSYGFRDAWAIGFDERYTVGVWVGRPDGAPRPGHYGRNTAAPLLYQVFSLLPERTSVHPGQAPAGVLTARNAQLPPRLRFLRTQARQSPDLQNAGAPQSDPLRIKFPVDGSTIELTDSTSLPLVASGGLRPLRWLVNGKPVAAASQRRQAFWEVDGEGAVRVTVIDKTGSAVSAAAWLTLNR